MWCVNYHKVYKVLQNLTCLKLSAKFGNNIGTFQIYVMEIARTVGLCFSKISMVFAPVLAVCFGFLFIKLSLCLWQCMDGGPSGGDSEYEKSMQFYRDI